MATKKIWSVYEIGASYEGPLTEVEASSERSALDSAAAFYDVPRRKLYAVPGALLTKASTSPRSHSTIREATEASGTTQLPSTRLEMIEARRKPPYVARGVNVHVGSPSSPQEIAYREARAVADVLRRVGLRRVVTFPRLVFVPSDWTPGAEGEDLGAKAHFVAQTLHDAGYRVKG
jgi:hypothetical protein